MKVVINADYGGFSLSPKALEYIAKKLGEPIYFFKSVYGEGRAQYTSVSIEEAEKHWFGLRAFKVSDPSSVSDLENYNWSFYRHFDDRADPLLVEVVEMLGKEANGSHASLKVVEIPDGIEWTIQEYDGLEWVAEKHRTWQ
jgi:hypothetical protein